MTELRKSLPPLPRHMQGLPVDDRGYPVPWFVTWMDGKPEFRLADPKKFAAAITQRRCWVCGGQLGIYATFVIGPMCVVNRTTAEPPCHLACAIFSATACPFLTLPKAERREANIPVQAVDPAGHMIKRNPGVTALYTSRGYMLMREPKGYLIRLKDPTDVQWYADAKTASRARVLEAIDSGMPILRGLAEQEGLESLNLLEQYYQRAMPLLPAN